MDMLEEPGLPSKALVKREGNTSEEGGSVSVLEVARASRRECE
jgi:hypothetical protein